MKKSHIKIIAKIEEKIAFNELLKQGQINDSIDTTPIENFIEGLKETIQVIKNLKQKDVNKTILKEADKFLCLEDDLTILETVNLIINDFNKSGDDKLIDYIENVTPIEMYEGCFTTCVFLHLIGIRFDAGDKIEFLF